MPPKSAPGAAAPAGPASRPARPPGLPVGDRAARALAVAYRARRAVLLEGPTGVGKSELVRQVAADLGVGFAVLDLSLLEPPDLVGLPVVAGGRTTYAAPSLLPLAGDGVLLLEELNRADRAVQQPALQLLTARRLHEYELPPGWVPFAAINPEDGEYQVTPLDPALRSRFCNLRVRADVRAWRAWADRAGVHPAVRRLAAAHDDLLDAVAPRTWAYVSDLLHALTPAEREDAPLVGDLLGGYLPGAWAKRVRDELEAAAADAPVGGFDVRELLTRYHADAGLRARLRAFQAGGRTDAFYALARRILDVVDGPELLRLLDEKAFHLDAFEALLADLPGDHRAAVQRAAGEHARLAELLPLTPADVVSAGYAHSVRPATVAGWAGDPLKRHRVAAFARAVAGWLDAQDVAVLRQNAGKMAGLAAFARQVRPQYSEPLDAVLQKHGLTV